MQTSSNEGDELFQEIVPILVKEFGSLYGANFVKCVLQSADKFGEQFMKLQGNPKRYSRENEESFAKKERFAQKLGTLEEGCGVAPNIVGKLLKEWGHSEDNPPEKNPDSRKEKIRGCIEYCKDKQGAVFFKVDVSKLKMELQFLCRSHKERIPDSLLLNGPRKHLELKNGDWSGDYQDLRREIVGLLMPKLPRLRVGDLHGIADMLLEEQRQYRLGNYVKEGTNKNQYNSLLAFFISRYDNTRIEYSQYDWGWWFACKELGIQAPRPCKTQNEKLMYYYYNHFRDLLRDLCRVDMTLRKYIKILKKRYKGKEVKSWIGLLLNAEERRRIIGAESNGTAICEVFEESREDDGEGVGGYSRPATVEGVGGGCVSGVLPDSDRGSSVGGICGLHLQSCEGDGKSKVEGSKGFSPFLRRALNPTSSWAWPERRKVPEPTACCSWEIPPSSRSFS